MIPFGESRDPLMRNQDVGIVEFAPGNLVYCDGNIYSIIGLDVQRSDAPESDTQYGICQRCGYATLSQTAQYCESCERELERYSFLESVMNFGYNRGMKRTPYPSDVSDDEWSGCRLPT